MTKTHPETAKEARGRAKRKDETCCFFASKLTWVTTLLRLLLIFGVLFPADLSVWLGSAVARSVLVNPVTTLVHVQEAVAIRQLSISPTFASSYAGQRIHLPPLLLAVAESMLNWKLPHVIIALLMLIVDLRIAQSMEFMARKVLLVPDAADAREVRLMKQMDPKILPEMAHIFPTGLKDSLLDLKDLPLFIAQLYYCNPVTVLAGSGASMGFQNLRLLFLTEALATSYAVGGSIITASFSLAVATYLDIHCAIFLVPVALIISSKNKSSVKGIVALFALFSLVLQALSMMLTGSANYFSIVVSTHLYTFRLRGLAPSLTTIWYLGMELFLRFQVYFEFLLAGVPYLTVVPITIRLYKYPAVLVAIFWFLGVLFRPPGTFYDLNVGFCLMLLSPRSLSRMRQTTSLISLCALPIPVILYMVAYWMWLEPGNGEANYLYFQCLAYGVFVGLIFLNFCAASIRRDKALRITEKSEKGKATVVAAEN